MQIEMETKYIVNDYIQWRLFEAGYSFSQSSIEFDLEEVNITIKNQSDIIKILCKKFEKFYNKLFRELCSEFDITVDNVMSILENVSNELFKSAIKWPQIIALFTFCGCLAVKCFEKEIKNNIFEIIKWLIDKLNQREFLQWIQSKGGWVKLLFMKQKDLIIFFL